MRRQQNVRLQNGFQRISFPVQSSFTVSLRLYVSGCQPLFLISGQKVDKPPFKYIRSTKRFNGVAKWSGTFSRIHNLKSFIRLFFFPAIIVSLFFLHHISHGVFLLISSFLSLFLYSVPSFSIILFDFSATSSSNCICLY